MSEDFTKEEKNWIRCLNRLAKAKPKLVRLCTTDGDLVACRIGSSCKNVWMDVSLNVSQGLYLTDAHDNQGFGDKQ